MDQKPESCDLTFNSMQPSMLKQFKPEHSAIHHIVDRKDSKLYAFLPKDVNAVGDFIVEIELESKYS